MNNVVNNTTYRKYDTDDRKFKPSEANGGNDFTNGPSDDEFDVLKEQVTSNKNQITSVKGRITTLENKTKDLSAPLFVHIHRAEGFAAFDTTWQDIYDCLFNGNAAYIVESFTEYNDVSVSEGSFGITIVDAVVFNDLDPDNKVYAVAWAGDIWLTDTPDGHPHLPGDSPDPNEPTVY